MINGKAETSIRKSKGIFNAFTEAKKEQFFGVLFASPAILGFFIFFLGPIIASIFYSLTDFTGFSEPHFIGLENYINIAINKDTFFYKSLFATFYFVLLNVPVSIIFSFFTALLLSQQIKGKAIFRAILYFPSIAPLVAMSFIWLWLLNPDLGLFNQILRYLHLPTSMWLASESTVIPSLVFTMLWSSGGTIVTFLAGLETIPKHYYEAADIDGGNSFHKLIHITIPMLSPTIFFNTIMLIINSFQIFAQPYIMTEGGPNNASLFFIFYIWREAFKVSHMGYASALAWVLFLIIMIFSFLLFRTQKSWVYYEGGKRS